MDLDFIVGMFMMLKALTWMSIIGYALLLLQSLCRKLNSRLAFIIALLEVVVSIGIACLQMFFNAGILYPALSVAASILIVMIIYIKKI